MESTNGCTTNTFFPFKTRDHGLSLQYGLRYSSQILYTCDNSCSNLFSSCSQEAKMSTEGILCIINSENLLRFLSLMEKKPALLYI